MSPGAIRTSKVLARMSRGRLLSVLACPGSSQQPHPWPILEWSLNNMRIDLPCLLHLPDNHTVRNYSLARRFVRSTLNPPAHPDQGWARGLLNLAVHTCPIHQNPSLPGYASSAEPTG